MFPFLIPVITPVLFILQIVGLVFLVGYSLLLVKGWWDVLNDQGLLDGLNDVVASAENALGKMHDSVTGDVLSFVRKWVDQVAQVFGIKGAWQMLVDLFQQMGVEEAWIWIAARTPLVREKATGIVSSLKGWNYDTLELNVEVTEIGQSIGRVVSSEFRNANSTAKEMRHSISEYRKERKSEGREPAVGRLIEQRPHERRRPGFSGRTNGEQLDQGGGQRGTDAGRPLRIQPGRGVPGRSPARSPAQRDRLLPS